MSIEYLGLSSINGPLIALEGVQGAFFDEIVEFVIGGSERKIGRIIELYEDKAVIQVFEGSENMSLKNTHTRLTGHPMEIALSPDMLGRTFNGIGEPIDDLGPIVSKLKRDVNGLPLNPVMREYPRNYIRTGISAIDGLTTLIRGQKLPIFSGNGLPHDQLAAQIVKQASLGDDSDEEFAIVFAAMGVKHDVADFFRRTFEESGVADHVAMFLNLANDPVVERLITPKVALTVAEYLAFEQNMHILVILTDMTSFAEAMREVSSSKGEIPSRKGFPGYLYSELAALYERAGIVQGVNGSVTQLPILTMPNDDITHPIPDLTGYITEGQIVLDRTLNGQSIYPPISILPSLSRLMKDGIGAGYTREDHQDLANQLFSAYAKVGDARNLASVIGEDELSPIDKQYLAFGKEFEEKYIGQGPEENRTMEETLKGIYEMNDIRYGGVLVREKTAPEGFVLDENVYYIMIDTDGKTYEVENEAGKGFINQAQKGSLKIIKTSSDGTKKGFEFRVTGPNGYDQTFVTDESGEILIENLRIGEYVVTELKNSVSANYKIADPVTVEIVADEVLTVNVYNEKTTVDVPKTGDETNLGMWIGLMICGLTGIAGTTIVCLRKRRKTKNDQ